VAEQVWTERVRVDAPPGDVWRVLLDLAAWPTWTRSMRAVTPLDTGPVRVGSTVRISQPGLPVTDWTVDALAPGRSFSWTSRRPGVRTVAEHVVEPDTDGAVVTLVLRQSGPLAGVSARLFGRLVRRYLRMEAHGLKARAELEGR
jgi:uncharacterized membrane protein